MKRIISLLLTVAMLLSMTAVFCQAADSEEEAMKEIQVYNGGQSLNCLAVNGAVQQFNYVYYLHRSSDGSTKEIPTYCVNPVDPGVPQKVPAGSNIKYIIKERESDPKIMGIVANGYPTKGLGELGLNDKIEGYYATKIALWCYIIPGWDISRVTVNPGAADQAQAQRVLAAAKQIYQYGTGWTKVLDANLTTTPEQEVASKTTIDGKEYKAQTFKVHSDTFVEGYKVKVSFSDPGSVPSGTRIVDMDNQDITEVKIEGEGSDFNGRFKVLYPLESVEGQTGSIQFKLEASTYRYGVFYASCAETGTYGTVQNYICDTDPTAVIDVSGISKYSDEETPPPPDKETGETSLRIVKLEEGTKTPLEGAIFEVRSPKGDVIGSFSTGPDGKVTIPCEIIGSYVVKEITPPRDHLLSADPTQTASVSYGKVTTVTFENAPYGNLRVEKVSDKGDQLKGVTVQVKHIESGTTYSAQTNAAGVATFEKLRPGAYEVSETAGIEGWKADTDTVKTVTVVKGETAATTLTNKELPGLRILKFDRQTMKVMTNVTFEVFKDGESLGTFQTNQMGEILLTNLQPGTYTAVETGTGDSEHILVTTPQTVELHAGDGIKDMTFFNDVKPGIRLVKVDSANPSKVIPNAKFRIEAVDGSFGPEEFTTGQDGSIDLSELDPGAYVVTEISCPGYVIDEGQRIIELHPNQTAEFVFTNSVKPTLRLVKYSSDGTPLRGVSFQLKKIADGTRYLDRTTDEKGEIVWEDLEPGVYSLQETATTSDHVLDVREYHVELFPGKTSTITIENQKRPNITVIKRDADTGEVIPNTVFTVRAADGHSVDEIKTGADGTATLENLLPGVYEISEKSVPSEYLLDAPSQLVTLYANRNHTVYFENHKKPSLKIVKVDSVTGEVIKGAEFSIWYGSNQTVTGELNDLGLYRTDENGLVELSGLRDGWYKIKEVEAAAGYQIKEPGEQSVFISGGENKVVTFENIPLSAIVIWKFDSVTGQAVSGAKFIVRYLGGESGTGGTKIGEYVTGSSGGVTITGLKAGTYVVEEIASDPDHVVDTAPQTVVLTGHTQDVVQVSFGNTPKGAVLVRKIDAVTHQPIAGVEFLVTDSKGAFIGTNNGKFVTDSSGSFTVSGLDPSTTLVVKEVRAKDGYVLDTAPQTVSVKPGKTVELEFRNQPLGSLLIRKVCSVNPSVTLSNAEFEVKYSDGAVVGNSNGIYRTDAKGEILITGLIPGKSVVVTETRAPDGFIKAGQSQTVEIKEGAAVTLTFANQPKGSIIIQKRDAQTGAPLPGAEFRMTTAAGCEVGLDGVIGDSTLTQNGVFTTDAKGEIKITNLAPGAYILNEIKAPDGYVIDQPITPVVVGKNGDTQTITIKNSKAGSLLIEKKDSVTNEPLEGVVFKITTTTGEFVPDENGQLSSNGLYTTDKNGKILLKGIVGTLIVTEEKTIPGYVIDEANRSKTIVVNPNDTQKLVFYNVPKNTLTIQKYATDTQSPLPGVKFKVTESSGSAVGNSNGIFITDGSGQAVVENLTPGTTIIAREIETVPGYTLETVPQTILVKEGEPMTLIFGNKPLANLNIIKKDSKGQPLPGAQFYVTDQHGLALGPSDGHYTTGFNGQVTVTGIQPDTAITVREEKAPDGYVLNPEPQTITVRSNEDNTLTFVNDKKGTLIIVKKDSATGKVLPGAEFQVTTSGGELAGNLEGTVTSNGIYTTNSQGEITISGLAPDTYVIKEIKAPDGYVLDSTPVTVKVNENDTQTITVKNTAKTSLIIQKYEGDTTTPVEGVVFLVNDVDGAPIGLTEGEFTTDRNGRIVIDGLTPGMAVTVREIRCPDEYVLDETPKSVKIEEGAAKTLTFRNQRKGALIIEKKDKLNGAPLAGAEFQLTYDDGSYLDIGGHTGGVYTTDRNGEIRLTGITGRITVKETKSVEGYVIDKETQTQTITVNPQETKTLTFYNEPLCSLTLKKVDSVSGKPVPDTTFAVKDTSGKLLGSYTTGKDGTAVVTGLVPNSTVVVSESKVPEGYVLNTKPQTITVKNGANALTSGGNNLTFENDPKMTLTIHKYIDGTENEPLSGVGFKVTDGSGKEIGPANGIYYTDKSGDIVIEGLEPGTTVIAREIKTVDGFVLDGTPQTIKIEAGKAQSMTFWNKRAGTLVIEKLDSVTKAPLAGAQFKVLYADGSVVDTEGGKLSSNGIYTTDQNGRIMITGVTGTIVVTEEKAPDGYVMDANSRSQTVTVNPQETQTLKFYNTPKNTLTIQKYVYGTNNEPLAGVEFLVTDSSGAVVGSSNGKYTTDKDGRIVIEGLEPGATITAKETKTLEGYVLDAEPQSIKIKAGEAQSMTFWNKEAGTLVIQKKDSVSGAMIPGAQFQLTYADGSFVDDDNGHLSSKGMYTTDEHGEIRISGIVGTIVVKETKPANGYVMDQSTQTQTVKINPQDTQTLVFQNEPLCSLTLTKVDSVTGKPVPGTEFTVKDGSGNVLGRYTTGKDGTVVVTGLVPNSTVVVSESRVPDGYVLNTTPQTITVKNGANTLNSVPSGTGSGTNGTVGTVGGSGSDGGNDLTFENDPKMTLTIHKYIDGTNNEPLAGVAFKLTDNSGAPVGPGDGVFYTNDAGEIVVDGLEPGTSVTAQEIKTAEGFVLDGTPKTVKITAGKNAPSLTFWNKKAGELVIRKLDKLTKEPLAGVEFELTYADGSYVDNANGHLSSKGLYTTDSKGEIRISGITGTIVVKETKTISGYTIDPASQTQTVTVNPADTQTLTFYNTPGTTLTIQKFVDGTTTPIQGVAFLVIDGSGAVLGPNNGEYITDQNGRIVINDLVPGTTITAKETRTAEGYVLDTTPQSIQIKEGKGQTLTFYNKSEGGLELIKVSASDKTRRIPNTTFEIRRKDGGLIDTVTTGKDGRVHVNLDAGDYYAVEIEAAEGFKLDDTPQYFTIEDGKTTTLTVTNKAFSGIVIHKIDSVTGEGIYDVKFLLYDSNKNPIGEYATDNEGYIYIDDATVSDKGRLYVRELEAAPGYELDKEYKTVYVKPGETIEIEWKNTPITGQIQVMKYAAESNPVTGTPAGAPLQGAVYEISDPRSNKVVDYITTDARGIAASKPLPLGRYKIVEVTAPKYWQLDPTVFDETLEYSGQIIKVSAYDKPSNLGVTITKRGNAEALSGSQMRYDFTVANTSNVPLENFYWHDRIPTDAAAATLLTTGTYSARLNYRILYKTNRTANYQVLASNLITSSNYSFSLNAIPVQAGEVVTDVYFDFGKVPVGFQSTSSPTLTVVISGYAANGYQLINRADVGGKYQGTWETGQATWLTLIRRLVPTTPLPKTGY